MRKLILFPIAAVALAFGASAADAQGRLQFGTLGRGVNSVPQRQNAYTPNYTPIPRIGSYSAYSNPGFNYAPQYSNPGFYNPGGLYNGSFYGQGGSGTNFGNGWMGQGGSGTNFGNGAGWIGQGWNGSGWNGSGWNAYPGGWRYP